MHRHIFRQRHGIGYNNCIMYRHILLLRHCVGNDGCIMHNMRNIDKCRIVHRHIFRKRHRIGHNNSVVNGVRNINIGGVVNVHRVDWGSGWCRCRRRGRLLLAIGKLSAEREPYGVARMQGVDVYMCHGIIATYLISFGNGVDSLSSLNDVHIVFAPMYHLLLIAHLDRCGARLLRIQSEN